MGTLSDDKEIKLGVRVKCVVTNFEGIVTHKLEYLDGTVDYGITPPGSKGDEKYPKVEYVNSNRLVFVDKGIHVEKTPPGMGFQAGAKP